MTEQSNPFRAGETVVLVEYGSWAPRYIKVTVERTTPSGKFAIRYAHGHVPNRLYTPNAERTEARPPGSEGRRQTVYPLAAMRAQMDAQEAAKKREQRYHQVKDVVLARGFEHDHALVDKIHALLVEAGKFSTPQE